MSHYRSLYENDLYNKKEKGDTKQVAQAELAIKQDRLREIRAEEKQLMREIARLRMIVQFGEQTGE